MRTFDKICEVLFLLFCKGIVLLVFGVAAKIWMEVFK